jgi:hypothetical protein
MTDQWEINGIRGYEIVPSLANKFSGPLVIIGAASCLWNDLAQVNGSPDFMAINFAGYLARKNIQHWSTCHPEYLPYYLGMYRLTYFPTNTENSDFNFFAHVFKTQMHTHGPQDAENNWQFEIGGGSSALFAVQVGLALGYAPVSLAGVPLEACGCVYDPPWVEPFDYAMYQGVWEKAAPVFAGRVKSYSGFTRELLGAPD